MNPTAPTSLDLLVPDVGEHDELELLQWNIAPGDEFQAGQEICELMTDKAVFPLVAERSGKLTKIIVEKRGPVEIHQKLGEYYEFTE